jgi:sec-independent protein translocase protein TatB
MARLRGMANEFRASFDEMARQSELDELRKEVEAMRAAAAKPVSDLKDQVSGLIDQSTVSLDTPAPADFAQVKASDLAEPEPEPSILPPINMAAIDAPAAKPKSAKPKTVKAIGSKSAPKSKADGGKAKPAPAAKAAGPKKAPKKSNAPSKAPSKPKASPPVEPGA